MIPSGVGREAPPGEVYQRGLVIDSQLRLGERYVALSISKGIGD